MQRLPTHISGVEILRAARKPQAKGSCGGPRKRAFNKIWPFEETFHAELGFTCELSFCSREPVTRAMRCLAGEVFLAVADVRWKSPTFGNWQGFYLHPNDTRTIRIPTGVACGWQVTSQIGAIEQRLSLPMDGSDWQWLRWNDLQLAIAWPEIPEWIAEHPSPALGLHRFSKRSLPRFDATQVTRRTSGRKSSIEPTLVHLPEPKSKLLQGASAKPDYSRAAKLAPEARPQTVTQPKPKSAAGRETRILVFGSSGGLGRDLCKHLSQLGTVIGACQEPERGSLLPVPLRVDVSRPASIRQAIRNTQPTLIVNAAGLTDVDRAEAEPRLAQLINATAPAIMADEATSIGASLVHFCSDMVYGGSGERPWREDDSTHPRNQYARSKLLGTEAVFNSRVPHLVLRAGWMYSNRGNNFLTALIDTITYRNSVELADDQVGTPTATDWLAKTTLRILAGANGNFADWLTAHGGLYHAAPLGYASRLDVGDHIVATCRAHALPITSDEIRGVSLESTEGKAKLPQNCRLASRKLALNFDIELPRWQVGVSEAIGNILGSFRLSGREVA